MLPLNPWMLLGLLAILVPIVIHILTRQTGQSVDWGAVRFLMDSLAVRNRRIRLEDALLMAVRCLLVGLLALALARPFIPPGSQVPWLLVIPLFLAAIIALAVGVVLWDLPKWRFRLLAAALAFGLLCVALITLEKWLNLSRFSSGRGKQDVMLIVDASTSMGIEVGGRRNFDRALDEARAIVRRSPRGSAFGLILGGPTPSARVMIPTGDRESILRHLDEAVLLDGEMAAYDCFTLASLGLTQGDNPGKQIVILSDGQRVGWQSDRPGKWDFLKSTFENLPAHPQVLLRELPLPVHFRNLSISSVAYSRQIVGVDRPVTIEVTVENTGSEAVTPGPLTLEAGDNKLTDNSLGQLLPGAKQTVDFVHHFQEPGAHRVQAVLAVEDEIPRDNHYSSALYVVRSLRILLVGGVQTGPFLERSAGFAALALAPLSGEQDNPEVEFLVDPEVIPAAQLPQLTSLADYDAVILADVPLLPGETADRLRDYVQAGGGLLIAAGPAAQPEFYNAWTGPDGVPWMPGRLLEPVVGKDGADPVSVALDTLRHPSLRAVANRKQSDLGSAIFHHYWKVAPAAENGAAVGGRFSNGDPWFVSRPAALGQVVLTPFALDTTASSFPSRQSFVPFIHEVTYFLASPGNFDLNLEPNWELTLNLAGKDHRFTQDGLLAEYYNGSRIGGGEPAARRQDAAIQFNWRKASPAPEVTDLEFCVRWSGRIQVPMSGDYRFDTDVRGRSELRIDGKRVSRQSIRLDVDQSYSFQLDYYKSRGDGRAILYWRSNDLRRQVVPPRAFMARRGEDEGEELAVFQAIDPRGETRVAKVLSTAAGAVAKIQGDIAAGAYRILVPEQSRFEFGGLLSETADSIPFTVKRNPAESHLAKLTPGDRDFLGQYLGLLYPDSAQGVADVLSGESFGEELWKPLAAGAFFLLLVESFLARWVAACRRSGAEQEVRFENRHGPTDAFREQLARLR